MTPNQYAAGLVRLGLGHAEAAPLVGVFAQLEEAGMFRMA